METDSNSIPSSSPSLKIVSINVASLHSAWDKGLKSFIDQSSPDIICLQETKLHSESKPPLTSYYFPHYHAYFSHCLVRRGYSGSAIYTKFLPQSFSTGFDAREGRVLALEFSKFHLVAVYAPNGGQNLEHVNHKVTVWSPQMEAFLNTLHQSKPLILAGDLNVAHRDIDIYEPKGHDKTPGFTPQERGWFDEFLKRGYVDVFRRIHPDLQQFSFFGHRFNSRARGRGWRLDYFVIPEADLRENLVIGCEIESGTHFSDHLPVVLTVNREMMVGEEDKMVSQTAITLVNSGEVFVNEEEEEQGPIEEVIESIPIEEGKVIESELIAQGELIESGPIKGVEVIESLPIEDWGWDEPRRSRRIPKPVHRDDFEEEKPKRKPQKKNDDDEFRVTRQKTKKRKR